MTNVEMSILGEVYNISMGAAATALSTILKEKVVIETSKTETVKTNDFVFTPNISAWGVEIKYTSELAGINVVVFKQSDIVKIINIIVDSAADESAELNETQRTAINEVIKHMMSFIPKNLSGFLEADIDISVSQIFKIKGDYSCLIDGTAANDTVISNRLKFIVDDMIDSEMIIVLSVPFFKETISKAKKAFGMTDE